jgi:hypothetical protein
MSEIENCFCFNALIQRLLFDIFYGLKIEEGVNITLQIKTPLNFRLAEEHLHEIFDLFNLFDHPKTDLKKNLSLEINPDLESMLVFSSSNNEQFFLSICRDHENGINKIRHFDCFKLTFHKGYSFLEQYLSLHCLIPQILPQLTPMRFAKIVYQPPENQEKQTSQSISLANATVWTSPGMLSSIEYMISLLRLSQYRPSIFLSLAPMMRQRVCLPIRCSAPPSYANDRLNISSDKKSKPLPYPPCSWILNRLDIPFSKTP